MNEAFVISICLVFASSIFFFTQGVKRIWSYLKLTEIASGALFTVGILILIHFAAFLTLFGIPGIYFGESIFWSFVILGLMPGLKILLGTRNNWRTADPSEKLIVVTGIFYLVFWTLMLKENIGLSSHHDGIAHLSWLIDVHRTGFAYLTQVPLSFSEQFGLTSRNFYPTGMQSLIAMVTGIWMRLGLTPTLVLKCSLILSHVSLVVTLLWGLRKHWPKIPLYLLVITALVSTAACRFPMDATMEGGLSRMVAFATLFPLTLVLGSSRVFGSLGLSGIILVSFMPSFLLHPSAFWLMALTLAHSVMYDWKAILFEGKNFKTKWSINKQTIFLLLAVLIAGGEILYLLNSTGAQSDTSVIEETIKTNISFLSKLSQIFQISLSSMYAPQSAFRFLFHLGIIGFFYHCRARLIPTRSGTYHLTLFAFTLMAMLSEVLPFPGSKYIGGAFYYHPARALPFVYISIWLVALSAFPMLEKLFQWFSEKIGSKRKVTQLTKGFFLVWAIQFQVMSWFTFPKTIADWDMAFKTPLWKKHQEIIEFVKTKVPKDGILVARPFDADVIGPASGRQSLFIYGDYVPNRGDNALKKNAWYEAMVSHLKVVIAMPASTQPCMKIPLTGKLADFNKPIYFILSKEDLDFSLLQHMSEGQSLCEDLKFFGFRNAWAIFRAEGL